MLVSRPRFLSISTVPILVKTHGFVPSVMDLLPSPCQLCEHSSPGVRQAEHIMAHSVAPGPGGAHAATKANTHLKP